MNLTMEEIMLVFYHGTGQGNNLYTQISNATTQGNLDKYYDKKIGIRWMHQCIRRLIDEGYLLRKFRTRPHGPHQWRRIPSLIYFTPKGVRHLMRRTVSGATQLLKKLLAYLNSDDKRWPNTTNIDRDADLSTDPDVAAGLKRLTEIVGKDVS